jgi:hypothetical protein
MKKARETGFFFKPVRSEKYLRISRYSKTSQVWTCLFKNFEVSYTTNFEISNRPHRFRVAFKI